MVHYNGGGIWQTRRSMDQEVLKVTYLSSSAAYCLSERVFVAREVQGHQHRVHDLTVSSEMEKKGQDDVSM